MERSKTPKFLKVQIFDHNWAPNCFTVTNSYMSELDLNTKETILAILEFLILWEKNAKFWKNEIFERNSAPN